MPSWIWGYPDAGYCMRSVKINGFDLGKSRDMVGFCV
jgi:hypothetical protein